MKRNTFGFLPLFIMLLIAAVTVCPHQARAQAGPSSLNGVIIMDANKDTYGVVGVAITPAATPTDIVVLKGSATKVVKVKRITVSGIASSAGSMDVSIVRRTTADTSGTFTNPTIHAFDSSDATSTASVQQYSANATLGTGTAIRNQTLNFGVAGAAGTVQFDFMAVNDQPLILRGTAQSAVINLNGQTVPTTGKVSYDVEWQEW